MLEKFVLLDTENYIIKSLYHELASRGWRVASSPNSIRMIYVPKIKSSFLVISSEEQICQIIQVANTLRDKGENTIILYLLDNIDRLPSVYRQFNGDICPFDNISCIADLLEYSIHTTTDTPENNEQLIDKVKWMTWRLEGLPKECLDKISQKYNSMEELIKDIDLIDDPSLEEIKLFLGQDFYVETNGGDSWTCQRLVKTIIPDQYESIIKKVDKPPGDTLSPPSSGVNQGTLGNIPPPPSLPLNTQKTITPSSRQVKQRGSIIPKPPSHLQAPNEIEEGLKNIKKRRKDISGQSDGDTWSD